LASLGFDPKLQQLITGGCEKLQQLITGGKEDYARRSFIASSMNGTTLKAEEFKRTVALHGLDYHLEHNGLPLPSQSSLKDFPAGTEVAVSRPPSTARNDSHVDFPRPNSTVMSVSTCDAFHNSQVAANLAPKAGAAMGAIGGLAAGAGAGAFAGPAAFAAAIGGLAAGGVSGYHKGMELAPVAADAVKDLHGVHHMSCTRCNANYSTTKQPGQKGYGVCQTCRMQEHAQVMDRHLANQQQHGQAFATQTLQQPGSSPPGCAYHVGQTVQTLRNSGDWSTGRVSRVSPNGDVDVVLAKKAGMKTIPLCHHAKMLRAA